MTSNFIVSQPRRATQNPLVYFISIRQGELTRILAGCAIVNPGLVVELVKQLRPADLVDEHARKFVLAIKPNSTNQDLVALAFDLGLAVEYTFWMLIADEHLWDLNNTARSAADEIKALTITKTTLHSLSSWIAETARYGAYRGAAA